MLQINSFIPLCTRLDKTTNTNKHSLIEWFCSSLGCWSAPVLTGCDENTNNTTLIFRPNERICVKVKDTGFKYGKTVAHITHSTWRNRRKTRPEVKSGPEPAHQNRNWLLSYGSGLFGSLFRCYMAVLWPACCIVPLWYAGWTNIHIWYNFVVSFVVNIFQSSVSTELVKEIQVN